ncbi:protein involved in gliding motility GldD [Jejuia pallidilutea]|jgi:gliding motility-associated lipoprotein GldD|uniref:Protein involved in gliding motility GldD n=1 Tax=Jejuia pallidilutea TaxID=504487 RepID=A0A362X4K0_9FLAO|nr:gliding motility lipoprotein GldD [Jejuia pallidilutea]PQV51677.1 protein involved in gliding motility GldD [Jejuia pallidilutea]
MKFKLSILVVLVLLSCGGEDYVPKPKAYLRLDYPKATYKTQELPNIPVVFEVSSLVNELKIKTMASSTKSYGINLEYKPLKATLFLTYKAINGSEKNLEDFLNDAQKLTLEHTKKADEIPVYPFENKKRKVYGMLSEVKGNAASPAQFYVTDSVNHFLTGSLYFHAKPNYDSILPAANFLQKDIKHIMETIEWQ